MSPLRVWSMCCFCIATASVFAETGAVTPALSLVGVTPDGGRIDHLGLMPGGMAMTGPDRSELVSIGTSWMIEGDLRANREVVSWLPEFELSRVPLPEWREHLEGARYQVRVLAQSALQSGGWERSEIGGAALVVAWLVGGRFAHVVVVPGIAYTSGPQTVPAEVQLTLKRGEETGAPVVLLWKEGRFCPPRLGTDISAVERFCAAALLDTDAELAETVARVPAMLRPRVLEDAARIGREGVIATLLDVDRAWTIEHDGRRPTAFSHAAALGRDAVVTRLIPRLSQKNRTAALRAALTGALSHRHESTASLIHAATFNGKKGLRDEALAGIALDAGMVELAVALGAQVRNSRSVDDGVREIERHAGAGHERMIRAMVDSGAVRGGERLAAGLCAGALCGSEEIARVLLAAGAQSNQANHRGELPLTAAVVGGRVAVAKRLLDAGADPNAVGSARVPAIWLATQQQDVAMLDLLLSRGAHVDDPLAGRGRLLDFALELRARLVVAKLAAAGARIDVNSDKAAEALSTAITMDAAELLDRALDDGWDIHRELEPRWPVRRLLAWLDVPRCRAVLQRRRIAIEETDTLKAGATSPRAVYLALPPEAAFAPAQVLEVQGIVNDRGEVQFPSVIGCEDLFLASVIREAAKLWTFEPAQRAGCPVVSRCSLPVRLSGNGQVFTLDEVDTLPVFLGPFDHLRLGAPLYRSIPRKSMYAGSTAPLIPVPVLKGNSSVQYEMYEVMARNQEALRSAQLEAEGARNLERASHVTVELTVEIDGRASDIRVLTSSAPAFARDALKIAEAHRFWPAMVDGRLVRSRVQQRLATAGSRSYDPPPMLEIDR